jgi:hypothetical protein
VVSPIMVLPQTANCHPQGEALSTLDVSVSVDSAVDPHPELGSINP